MKIETIHITLTELKEAIRQWCYTNASTQPEIVKVLSGDTEILSIKLSPSGEVRGISFGSTGQ